MADYGHTAKVIIMNRHQRRAAAAKERRKTPLVNTDPNSLMMMVGSGSPIPMEIKRDIAFCVRSIRWDGSGQDCIARAALGKHVLELLGFEGVETIIGSLVYRAGYDPVRDVCAFSGPGNTAMQTPEGFLLGHIWNEVDDEIIDFSCGDWPSIKADDANLLHDDLGEVRWVASPPEFVWAHKELFDWKPRGTPELGRIWYGPFRGEFRYPRDNNIDALIAAAEPALRILPRFVTHYPIWVNRHQPPQPN